MAVAVAEAVPLDVEEGNSGGRETLAGRVTPMQRAVTLDAPQQESVAFGELAAQ